MKTNGDNHIIQFQRNKALEVYYSYKLYTVIC